MWLLDQSVQTFGLRCQKKNQFLKHETTSCRMGCCTGDYFMTNCHRVISLVNKEANKKNPFHHSTIPLFHYSTIPLFPPDTPLTTSQSAQANRAYSYGGGGRGPPCMNPCVSVDYQSVLTTSFPISKISPLSKVVTVAAIRLKNLYNFLRRIADDPWLESCVLHNGKTC